LSIPTSTLIPIAMHSHFSPWKTAIAVVVYVVLCMVILCFSPPDYAARRAPDQNPQGQARRVAALIGALAPHLS
jgi:hypothetical protein